MKILEYYRLAIQNNARRFYLTSGTKPYLQSESGLLPMNEKALVPSEVYSIMDEFLEPDLKDQLLEGSDVQAHIRIDEKFSLRIVIFRQRGSLAMSVKIVESGIRSIEDCSLPAKCYESLLKRPSGLLLIGGGKDSGKSTTARALVDALARKQSLHVVCYEKIIESEFPQYPSSLISRRLLGVDVPELQDCAKMITREDVDVFYLEEMDNSESFQLALELASRGVLVLATTTASGVQNLFERVFHGYSNHQFSFDILARYLIGVTHQTRVYSAFHERNFVIFECFKNYPSMKRHLRDGQIFPLVNFMKQAGKPDCLTYHRGYEDLVANDVLRWDEVPDEYRS